MSKVASREEAFSLFERYRRHLLDLARVEAWKIACDRSEVDIRQVREVLDTMGVLHPDLDERWLGAVFPGRSFEWTGRFRPVEIASIRTRQGGAGGRDIRIWQIKEGAEPPRVEPWTGPQPEEFRRLPVPKPEVLKDAFVAIRELVDHRKSEDENFVPPDSLQHLGKWIRQEMEP